MTSFEPEEKWPAPVFDGPAEDRVDAVKNELIKLVFPEEGHDYNTSCDAMWKAAQAVFEFVAHELSVTGYQASMAALAFYGKVMHVDGPYMVVRLEEALYPQYDKIQDVMDWMGSEDARKWLKEQAQQKLAQQEDRSDVVTASPKVLAHWRDLAAMDD